MSPKSRQVPRCPGKHTLCQYFSAQDGALQWGRWAVKGSRDQRQRSAIRKSHTQIDRIDRTLLKSVFFPSPFGFLGGFYITPRTPWINLGWRFMNYQNFTIKDMIYIYLYWQWQNHIENMIKYVIMYVMLSPAWINGTWRSLQSSELLRGCVNAVNGREDWSIAMGWPWLNYPWYHGKTMKYQWL